MSRKNFKVATTEDGKTTLTKIDKTPTGKVKTLKDKEAIKAAREEQYKNFRINALNRRAKHMGLSEEQIKVKVEELKKQIAAPNNYNVLIWYDPKDYDMMKEALKNEDMTVDILTTTYLFITVDSEGLATLRSIAPPTAKIYPHVKRKPSVLPIVQQAAKKKKTRTKAEKKNLAKAAKAARKALNRNKGNNTNSEAKERLQAFLKNWHETKRDLHGKKQKRKAFAGKQASYEPGFKYTKVKAKRVNFTKTSISRKRRIVIPKASENASKSVKMASMGVKQAA